MFKMCVGALDIFYDLGKEWSPDFQQRLSAPLSRESESFPFILSLLEKV
jgi:hypothetical protein